MTLIFAFALAISMTVVSIYTVQISITEQKISANHYHAKQAFEAAQAGLDVTLNQLNYGFVKETISAGGTATENSFSQKGINLHALSMSNTFNNARSIGRYSIKLSKNRDDPTIIDISSLGFSGDNLGDVPNQIMSQRVIQTSLIAYKPPAPLIAKGSIHLGNNLTIINKTNSEIGDLPRATWSGGVTTQTNTGIPANIDVKSNDGNLDGGSGIYQNYAALNELSNDDFFLNFFTDSKSKLISKALVINCLDTCRSDSLIDPNGKAIAQLFWIKAKNKDGTSGTMTFDRAINLGTNSEPVLLIVDGNIRFSDANANIVGLIYTTQNITLQNTAGNIRGSLISERNIALNGNLTISYDLEMLNSLQNRLSRYVRIAGSWKDF